MLRDDEADETYGRRTMESLECLVEEHGTDGAIDALCRAMRNVAESTDDDPAVAVFLNRVADELNSLR